MKGRFSKDFERYHEYPEEAEGTEYVVVGSSQSGHKWKLREIIRLMRNDGSNYPSFESLDGRRWFYYEWYFVERLDRSDRKWAVGQIETL